MVELVGRDVPVPAVPASERPLYEQGASVERPVVPREVEKARQDVSQARENKKYSARLSAFGQVVLRACVLIDGWVTGKRSRLFFGLVSLSFFVPFIDAWDVSPSPALGSWTASVTFVCLMYVWCIGFAFAGNLRDDLGKWQGGLVWERLRALAVDILARFQEFGISSGAQRATLGGVLLLMGGMLCLLAANTILLFHAAWNELTFSSGLPHFPDLRTAGFFLGLVGGLVWYWGYHRQNPSSAPVVELQREMHAALELPPIVDLSDLSRKGFDQQSVLASVLDALASWRVRSLHSEREYQDALKRHFERTIPKLRLERERRLEVGAASARADFVIADTVLLEFKRGVRKKSERDRLVGQMRHYSRCWADKPTLLVLFETTRDDLFDGPLTPELFKLHADQPMATVRMRVPKRWVPN